METGEQHTMSMSSPDLSSSIQSSLDDFSREESDVYVGNGDLHREEDDDVAVARPPRRAAASAEVVLSGQAALDVLDQLQRSGQVGRERASNLRRRYLLLKETLESSRASETSLLAQAKQFGQVLTQQQRVLEKGAGFPDGDSGESSRLRQILLSHTNQLEQSQQRLATLNTQLSSLEEEHAQVSRELDQLPHQSDVEARLQDLNRQLDDLRDEIRKRSKDIQRYNGELASREHRLSSVVKNTEELKTMEGGLQDELIAVRAAPVNLPREIDSVHKRTRDTQRQMKDSDSHLNNLTTQLEDLQNHHNTLQKELKSANQSLVEAREEGSRLHDLERQARSSLDQAKERQVALLEQQASLELGSRHRAKEQRRLYEVCATLTRDNDHTARLLKKTELHLEAAKQGDAPLQQRCQCLQVQVEEGKVAARERQKKQDDIRLEAETLRRGLNVQESVSSAQLAVLESKQHEEERVRARLAALSSRLQELNKEAVALARMRDKDSRTCRQAKLSKVETEATLYTQEAQLREQTKALAQLEQQLKDFAEAYKLIKTERNHTHSQIHKLQQLACEMREKWRVLQNEAEVLTSSARDKEKLLQKCSLVHSSKSMERDGERQEASQLALGAAQNRADLEAQRETLAKLTHEVSSLEHQLNQLRKRYEHALQERNDAGLQLIERNEEVCVFHERLNMQEAVLREAALDLMAREEEIKYLKLELSQLQTHILVSRKGLPEKSRLQAELDNAQIQLRICEKELRKLESRVEDAQDPSRLRLLGGGPQSSQDDLCRHLEVLEERLAGQEQDGLEKELLYEQVCRLADRAQTRVTAHRDSTLQVAQRVNLYQSKIKDATHKTMALVSELTMQQANALRLKYEVQEREAAVDRAYLRLQAGQPPDEAIEQQWQQLLREEQQRKEACLRKLSEEREETVGTAEPRPNAYLPSGEGDLPLPKPYGSHAPFKPSQAGANMRHIRKPEPKPIDI